VEYALTRLGASLLEVVGLLLGWATAHHQDIREHRARCGQAAPAKR
jgi:DNA-binding HxlR family transcriptional regulator